ncbi:MAG: hypothetical protein ACRD3T_08515 [Terriglobia bacterium]
MYAQKGDRLFRPRQQGRPGLLTDPSAVTGIEDPIVAWELYGLGYRRAADLLLGKALDEHPSHCLIYPIVFLSRHYVELCLKALVLNGSALVEDETPVVLYHRLQMLWGKLRPLVPAVWPGVQPDQLEAIEACFNEMHEIDRKSMAFRYPFDRQGNQHLGSLSSIDLLNLRETMDGIANFLFCVGEAIAQQLEWQSGSSHL